MSSSAACPQPSGPVAAATSFSSSSTKLVIRPSPSASLLSGSLASWRPWYLAPSARESPVGGPPSRRRPMKRIRAARTARFAVNPHAGWTADRAA
eukprot:13170621-Alexandrium_andersonii.AAC.1